jgi:glutaredoxin 3
MGDTPKVEIYIGATCGYCMRALRLLDSKNVTYEQIDTSMNSARRADMRSRSGGHHTVPQIFIDNEHIGDCEELFRLENAGHLDRLLRVS